MFVTFAESYAFDSCFRKPMSHVGYNFGSQILVVEQTFLINNCRYPNVYTQFLVHFIYFPIQFILQLARTHTHVMMVSAKGGKRSTKSIDRNNQERGRE